MSFIFNFIAAFVRKMLELLQIGGKLTHTLSIYVKTNTGRTLSVNLEPQWDIKNVKELVAPQLGLQPDEVKIIFAGKELSDATTIEVGERCNRITELYSMNFNCSNVILGSRACCTPFVCVRLCVSARPAP